jgi:N-acetylmuramoyl-L-alanine amidase
MWNRKKEVLLAGLLCGGVLAMILFLPGGQSTSPAFARMTEQTLVIDPGHGGEDGGAVSVSGVAESGINLAIALDLDQLMGFYGVPVVLTRTEDVSIHDASAQTLREKKVSDLHNRVALINGIENATLISIHQNSFSNPSYHGTQVFYGDEALSLPLAKEVQTQVSSVLDAENTRTPQAISSSVYLMSHISCRAILVECGFLSNPEEDQLLQEKAYQMKLAMVLTASYLACGEAQEGEGLV